MIEQPDRDDADAQEDVRQQMLDAFAQTLAKKRLEAVQARQASGIEVQWKEDEEFYEGIDAANRDEVSNQTKPVSQTGGASTKIRPKSSKSTVFLPITRPYVDFSAGRAA